MITQEELIKLARLSKLSLENEDTRELAAGISGILEFADQIAQATLDLEVPDVPDEARGFREDIPVPSFPVEEILSNAGEHQEGYFVARNRGGKIK